VALIVAFGHDVRVVQGLFQAEKDVSSHGLFLEREGPPLHLNMPPVSGALIWCRGLIERVTKPMERLQQSMRLMLDTEEVRLFVQETKVEGEGGQAAAVDAAHAGQGGGAPVCTNKKN
jgi:dynein heavy chain